MTTRVLGNPPMQLFDNCSALETSDVKGTAETAILASAVARIGEDNDAVVALGTIYVTPGAGCTGIVVRFREGYGLSGAIGWEPVGLPNGIAVTPGQTAAIPLSAVMDPDCQQVPAGDQYTITVQQVGTKVTSDATIVSASVAWFAATWLDIE